MVKVNSCVFQKKREKGNIMDDLQYDMSANSNKSSTLPSLSCKEQMEFVCHAVQSQEQL